MPLVKDVESEDMVLKIRRVLEEKDRRNAELVYKLSVAEKIIEERRESHSERVPMLSERRRRLTHPEHTYLFCHPSWWDWWLKDNFTKNPKTKPITGIFMVYVESYESDSLKHHERIKREVKGLGLRYVFGVRHSHEKASEKKLPLSETWQKRKVLQLARTKERSILLDMEPYYKGPKRYHGVEDWGKLAKACRPWSSLSHGGTAETLWVYPAYPSFSHSMALMGAVSLGSCVDVIALDHTTYWGPDKFKGDYKKLKAYMSEQDALWNGLGQEYSPGLYLHWLKDKPCMRVSASYRTTWFFPRTSGHPDDLPHFGTPDWNPRKVR